MRETAQGNHASTAAHVVVSRQRHPPVMGSHIKEHIASRKMVPTRAQLFGKRILWQPSAYGDVQMRRILKRFPFADGNFRL